MLRVSKSSLAPFAPFGLSALQFYSARGKFWGMENALSQDASDVLSEIARLMKLKGENVFKVRAFEKAVDIIEQCEDLEARIKGGTLTELSGIGKGIEEAILDWWKNGKSTIAEQIRSELPEGLLELVKIQGLGPKKAIQLIEELGVKTLGELEYACKENRLVELKGFGLKNQQKILQSVQFLRNAQGQLRMNDYFALAKEFIRDFSDQWGDEIKVAESGTLRRRYEAIDRMDFVLKSKSKNLQSKVDQWRDHWMSEREKKQKSTLPIHFEWPDNEHFFYQWAKSSSSDAHWKALGAPTQQMAESEEKFYQNLGLPWIAPEMRETGEEVQLAKQGKLADVLPWKGIQGVFHIHTQYSDGSGTLEEMVQAALARGYHYIGISDHSQSAFYAQGLKREALNRQYIEVQKAREKFPDIKIYWGIESDILKDGSLDYPQKDLDKFDFIIASIHSRFGMGHDEMTDRIVRALEFPQTKFLGHPTGRLILGRPPFEADMDRIIEACAKHQVAIEINANPYRLDLDWRMGAKVRAAGALVSVNPDAHSVDGLDDVRYGVAIARKALIPQASVVNSWESTKVEEFLSSSS